MRKGRYIGGATTRREGVGPLRSGRTRAGRRGRGEAKRGNVGLESRDAGGEGDGRNLDGHVQPPPPRADRSWADPPWRGSCWPPPASIHPPLFYFYFYLIF